MTSTGAVAKAQAETDDVESGHMGPRTVRQTMEIRFSNSPAKNTITVHLARPLSPEITTALQDLIRRATEGDTEAMGELGATFKYESPDAAIVLFQRAADLGNPKGMYELALMLHDTGKREKAKEWWTKAALLGNTKAMVQLGHISRHSGDYEKAKEWWTQSAGMGNARAMLALGDLMSRQSLQEGRRWYEEAANLGDAEAMGELTRLLWDSEPGEASRWFDLIVAKEEKPSTVHKIAERLEPTQSARAIQLWLQAAKGGYVPSMLALARALPCSAVL